MFPCEANALCDLNPFINCSIPNLIEWFECERYYTLVMDRINYDLDLNDYMANFGPLNLPNARLIFRQVGVYFIYL